MAGLGSDIAPEQPMATLFRRLSMAAHSAVLLTACGSPLDRISAAPINSAREAPVPGMPESVRYDAAETL